MVVKIYDKNIKHAKEKLEIITL